MLQDHEDIELHDPPIIFPADKKARGTSAIDRWFRSNRNAIQQLNADSTVALLSTLLPERRTDRVYGIQAPKLCHTLCRCLGLRAARAKDLQAYTQPGRGNLGTCLERVFVLGGAQGFPAVSLDEVDDLMQFLAGVSRFSDPSIPRQPPGSSEARNARIANLLMRMSPLEAKWLIRLILKDFTPVRLDENLVLNGYHFMLPGILRFQNRFDAAISMLKGPLSEFPDHCDKRTERLLFRGAEVKLKPVIGVKVGRPHFHKARGIDNCISMLGGSRWVLERKYGKSFGQS